MQTLKEMGARFAARGALFASNFFPLTGEQISSRNLTPFFEQAFSSGSIADFINAAFRAAIGIGAILAVLQIAYGGYIYMTKDLWSAKQGAKDVISNALIGLLLLLAVYLILNQIDPRILELKISGQAIS